MPDKFSSAFSRGRPGANTEPPRERSFGGREDSFARRTESAPLKVNSRNFGSDPSEREAPREREPREPRGDFGGERSERGFGGDRGGYGGDRGGERGGYGGDRGFGGDRGDRERGEREPFRSSRPPREEDNTWEEDPRFASKFKSSTRPSGDARSGDARRGGGDFVPGRREREAMNPNYASELRNAPLPSAPRATLANSAFQPKQNVFEMAMSKATKKEKKPKKETATKTKTNKNKFAVGDSSDEEEEEEEETTSASVSTPAAAPAPKEEVKPVNTKAPTAEVVAAALAAGHKGPALTAAIKSGYEAKDLSAPLSVHGFVLAIFTHMQSTNESFSSKWYKPEQYGHALKELVATRPMNEQIDAIYAVQEFCHSQKFPKIDVSGKQKKLIEVIVTALLVTEAIDVDTVLGWADDETDRDDVKGRVDAIVQMTTMLSTLREPDEVEEADLDDDFHVRDVAK